MPKDLQGWADLRKGSRQGFVILLLSLSWWAARTTKKMLLSAVLKDVLLIVQQLAENVSEHDTSVLRKRA